MDDLENCQVCHGFWRSTALFLKIIKLKIQENQKFFK